MPPAYRPIDPARLDPAADFKEDTHLVFDALTERFGEELAREVMACLIEAVDGDRVYIVSAEPIRQSQARGRAVEMLRGGTSEREVCRQTGLKQKHLAQLQRRMVE